MQPAISVLPITYRPSSADWFALFRDQPFAIWLDSGQSNYGRWDILSAAPFKLIETRNATTTIIVGDSTSQVEMNPFECVKQVLWDETTQAEFSCPHNLPSCPNLPFWGGALGYFGYELGSLLEHRLMQTTQTNQDMPDMLIGIYPWALLQDHHKKEAWLVINPILAPDYDFSFIQSICFNPKQTLKPKQNPFHIETFKAHLPLETYQQKFEKINAYIQAGDVYQVNFAQTFSAPYSGDSFTAYLKLREALPSPFSAFMTLPEGCSLLSLSPERFIKLSKGIAETQPIKGTIARGINPIDDQAQAAKLQASLKDRAENLMIVDLLRNDFSRSCDKVAVPKLFELQSFANVHHLVSTVTGELKADKTAVDLIANAFPGGSITGAPKIRAMEIIAELETESRSVYCGSIGYISACGKMDTNIAIRTLVCDAEKIYCWGGGGIVADSVCDEEYRESIAKVKILMDTLEKHFMSTAKKI